MKKLFLAVALVAATISVQATDWAWADQAAFDALSLPVADSTSTTVNGLTYADLSGSKDFSWSVASSTGAVTVGDKSFTGYIKTNAASYASVAAGVDVDPFSYKNLYFEFNVTAASTISVYAKSGSSENRVLYILDVTNNVILNSTDYTLPSDGTKKQITATTSGACKVVVAGGATVGTLGDGTGGSISVYGISYGPATAVKDAISSDLLKLAGDVLVNPTNLEVEVYSVAGVKVLSSSDASINVSALSGAFVAKTAEGTLKFVK